MNNYLSIAKAVLRNARQPLSARQMMKRAYELELVPSSLFGRTQFKTLHARISEDILCLRERSEFVRTEPGRFFLRSLLKDPTIPEKFKREFPASLRADQLRNYDVLSFNRRKVEGHVNPICKSSSVEILDQLNGKFVPFAQVHKEVEVSLRVFAILYRGREVVARRNMSFFGDPLSGTSSLGLQGYLKPDDRNLFSYDKYGLFDAAFRSIYNQLYLTKDVAVAASSLASWRFFGLLYDSSDNKYKNALAAIVSFDCTGRFDPVSRFGSSGAFYWLPVDHKPNDISHFDPWSKYLLISGHLADAIN